MRSKIPKNSIHHRIRRYMAICYSSYFLASFIIICVTFLTFINIFGSAICLDYSYDLASACSLQWNGKVSDTLDSRNKQEAKFLIDIVKAKFIVDDLLQTSAPALPQSPDPEAGGAPQFSFGDLEDEGFFRMLLHGIVSVRIEKDGVVLKDYFDGLNTATEANKLTSRLLGQVLNTQSTTEVLTVDDQHLGSVSVRINQIMLIGIYIAIVAFCFVTLLIVVLISKAVSNLLSHQLITPVLALQSKMENLADGDVQSALVSEIHFDKPLKEIQDLVDVNRRITEKMKTYIEFIDDQKNEIKNLLDNTGEGFLFFGKDLLIRESYSRECSLLFAPFQAGVTFSSLLHAQDSKEMKDPTEAVLLDKIFHRILDSQDLELYESLLPGDLKFSGKWLELRYRLITGDSSSCCLMVIINDITGKKALESELERERRKLRALVSMLTSRDEFLTMITDYKAFIRDRLAQLPELLMTAPLELFREVHTFRGNLAQYEMTESATLLNTLEEYLYQQRNEKRETSYSIPSRQFADTLELEISKLSEFVGGDFFSSERIYTINQGRLSEIEEILRTRLDPEGAAIALAQIAKLKRTSLKQLLRTYSEFSVQLAARQEKLLQSVDISGPELDVDYDHYTSLLSSLVHIFRNAIAHGIEPPEERLALGKNEAGQIRCILGIAPERSAFSLTIEDDGKGISLEQLAQHAGETPTSLDVIFMDGISSIQSRDQLAGSGVGLAAVKAEVERLGGSIHASSEKGIGTSFLILLPMDERYVSHSQSQ